MTGGSQKEKSSQFRFHWWLVVRSRFFYSAATECVSAAETRTRTQLRGCPPRTSFPSQAQVVPPALIESGRGWSGLWPGTLFFSLPFPLPISRLIFLSLSGSSGPVGPRSLYFGWCEKWASELYQVGGRPWSDLTRVVDKPLAGSPPTKIGARRTSSDEARNAAALRWKRFQQECRRPPLPGS